MIGGQPFAGEMVQTRGRHLAGLQRVDERVDVVQLSPSGIEEDDTVTHGGELFGSDHPDGVVGDRRVQETTSDSASNCSSVW